jgi:hypothetical protein
MMGNLATEKLVLLYDLINILPITVLFKHHLQITNLFQPCLLLIEC